MAYTSDYKTASDETVWEAEQKQRKLEAQESGTEYEATSKWWSPTVRAGAKQTASAIPRSPYGYDQAMGGDGGIIGSAGVPPANSPQVWGPSPLSPDVSRTGGGGGAGGAGGGSYRPKAATGAVQTTKTTYTGTQPTLDLPDYDKSKIKAYRQKIAGPAMRKLRSELRRAMAASYENPNVRRHILRGALEGYGIGLGSIQAESERAAASRYQQEYGMEYQKSMSMYQASLSAYMSSAVRTTTSKNTYGYGEEGEGEGTERTRTLMGGPGGTGQLRYEYI